MTGAQDGFLLLHIANTSATAMRVDSRILVLAIGALVAAAIVIWVPPAALRRWRSWRRAGRGVVYLLVFLAVLPTVLPYDHLFLHDAHAAADESIHQAHCHVVPGSCSDA